MWKRIGAVLASLLVSGVFLWLALRGVPVGEVFGSMAQANPFLVAAAVAVGLLGLFTRAIRWRGLVNDRVGVGRAFHILGITFLLNLLPFRLGEVARTVLASREDIPLVTAATSIVVERLLDTVLVLIVLSVCISQIPVLPPEVTQAAPLFGLLAIVGFGVLLAMARYPQWTRGVLKAVTARVSFLQRLPLENLLDQALDGLHPLVDLRRFGHAVLWTLISWGTSYLVFYFSQLALNLPADTLLTAALAMSLASFSVAVPVTVAAIGPFEGAVRVAGQVFDLPAVLSTALGFLVHAVSILTYTIAGTLGFLGMGVAIADMVQENAALESHEEDSAPAQPPAV